MYKMIGKIGAFVYCAAIVVASVLFTIRDADRNLRKEVVVEAGSKIKIQDFFDKCPSDAKFMTDVSSIDTTEPAVYQLKVFYDEAFEKDVILRIEDHTAPRAVALPKSLYTTWKAPDAADCVGYLYDLSGIAKVEFESEPVFEEGGVYDVPVAVTDVYGNTASVAVPFEVIDDRKAPEIKGVHNLEMVVNGEEPDFFDNVTITDDHDEDPVIKIDDSEVDYEKAGTYIVKYEGVDKAGNVQTVEAEIKIKKQTKAAKNAAKKTTATVAGGTGASGQAGTYTGGGSKKSEAKRLAGKIMAGLWRKNQVETARAIFNWVHNNIYYTHVSGRLSLEAAAYRGFSRRSGDCYVFYACCKMLLDQAGIPNMMVKRYPVTRSNHYWNLVKLNGQWYHCDSTVFKHRKTIYFMCTDKQINDQYHHFNGKLYPARAGGSTDFKPTDTPKPTATNTPVPKPTVTSTPVPKPTVTTAPSATPTGTSPKPTTPAKETPVPTATPTPVPAAPTATDTPKPTSTPKPTATNTPKPAATNTPKPTDPKPEDPKTEE